MKTNRKEVLCMSLRAIAANWHNGQWSYLYEFASTGSISCGILGEISELLKDNMSISNRKSLERLYDFCNDSLNRSDENV